jgi:hypothetical protein
MTKIRIGLTGDYCPIGRMHQVYLEGTWQESLETVKPFFDQNDFNVIDLECPLTTRKQKIIKTGPHIKSLPDTAEILNFLNCNHVVTANNHFKDFGWMGMQETYQTLIRHGITWLGSGENIHEASKPLIIDKNGLKVALLNMAEHEWTIATDSEPGCNSIDYPRALRQIHEAKLSGVDFVIVILHGGHEHYPLPSPRMKAQFRFMIDAGADAVVGHHTHIISGYEVYKNKPIFYSLGNFCFDWPTFRNSSWNKGIILRLILEKGQFPKYEYEFIQQNDDFIGVRFASIESKLELENELIKLNSIIADDILVATLFANHAENRKSIMLSQLQPYYNRLFMALYRRGLLPDLMGKSKKKMIQILTQCESHREALLYALNSVNK